MPAWQVLEASGDGRHGVLTNEFLLFPTAGYILSRISSLSACSLCLSPCSFIRSPSMYSSMGSHWTWYVLRKLLCVLKDALEATVRLRDLLHSSSLSFQPQHTSILLSCSSLTSIIPAKDLPVAPSSSLTMLTPAQLAHLRAHLRPLMYTLSFAPLVTVTGIILILFLRLNRSKFLLLGMFSCLGMLYAAAFFYCLWRDLRLRLFHANRGRVRPRRTRSFGPGMLVDDIGMYWVCEIFETPADEIQSLALSLPNLSRAMTSPTSRSLVSLEQGLFRRPSWSEWVGSADAGAGASISTVRSSTTARLDQAKNSHQSSQQFVQDSMSVGAKGSGYSALPNGSPSMMQPLAAEDYGTPLEMKELLPAALVAPKPTAASPERAASRLPRQAARKRESFVHTK